MNSRRAWLVVSVGAFAYLIGVMQRSSLGIAGIDATERFEVTAAAVGGTSVPTDPVFDDFPDGHFFDLTDAQRLAAPAFVRREAGVAFGNDHHRTDTGAAVPAPVGYKEIVVGPDGVPMPEPQTPPPPRPPLLHVFDAGLRIGAAARADTRRGPSERYTEPALAGAPRINDRWRQP